MIEKFLVASLMAAFVFGRAFQQRNVTLDNRIAVIPTSWVLAVFEVSGILGIVNIGFSWSFVFILGTMTGCATLSAMWLHKRVFKNGRTR